jgi:hypothetical protein
MRKTLRYTVIAAILYFPLLAVADSWTRVAFSGARCVADKDDHTRTCMLFEFEKKTYHLEPTKGTENLVGSYTNLRYGEWVSYTSPACLLSGEKAFVPFPSTSRIWGVIATPLSKSERSYTVDARFMSANSSIAYVFSEKEKQGFTTVVTSRGTTLIDSFRDRDNSVEDIFSSTSSNREAQIFDFVRAFLIDSHQGNCLEAAKNRAHSNMYKDDVALENGCKSFRARREVLGEIVSVSQVLFQAIDAFYVPVFITDGMAHTTPAAGAFVRVRVGFERASILGVALIDLTDQKFPRILGTFL